MENQHNKNISPELLKYRDEIDKIDQDIINLLDRRIEIVKNVGNHKKNNNDKFFIRSGREADMVRHLTDKTKNPIHKATIFSIWRKIITYANILEQNIKIGLLNPLKTSYYQHHIKEYYNNFVPIVNYSESKKLILDIKNNKAQLAIFPINIKDNNWWIDLAQENNPLKIFVKIPFIKNNQEDINHESPEIFIGAVKQPEKSENDKTLLVIKLNKNIEQNILEQEIINLNLKSKIIQTKQNNDNIFHFMEINDFYQENDLIIQKLQQSSIISDIKIIGYYPTEIVI